MEEVFQVELHIHLNNVFADLFTYAVAAEKSLQQPGIQVDNSQEKTSVKSVTCVRSQTMIVSKSSALSWTVLTK